MSWIYVNPFTGYVHISHLKIYEYQSDTIFVKADGVSVSYGIWKMLHKTYQVNSLTLTRPWARIEKDRAQFNFTDLIQKFSQDSTKPKPAGDTIPLHLNLLDLAITDGEFHYYQPNIPINYYVKDVNFKSSGLRWNVDSITGSISLKSGPAKGDVKADFMMNLKNQDYRIAVVINRFELDLINQYLKDLANYGSFRANLDADIKASGNFKDQLNVTASGNVGINDFHFGKKPGNDFVSFDTLLVAIQEVNPKQFKYIVDSIALRKPFFKYERYDYLDNLQTMFGAGGANYKAAKADSTKFNLIVELSTYINQLAKNFLQSYYKIDRIAIYNGDIRFSDYAIREKFTIDADPLNITANAIDKSHKRIGFSLRSGILPYGSVGLDLSIDPNDYNQFDIDYGLHKVSVPSFNPYIITYTSFPLDRGTLDIDGKWTVRDGDINSDNHLLIVDPRTGKRLHKKDTKWIPVPLIMSLVRSTGNAIDFDIPIKGNLKNPKFKVWGAIKEVLTNIFVKPPSSAYLFHVKEENNAVEKLLTVKWPMRSDKLKPNEEKFLSKVADFLKGNAATSITIDPLEYTIKEKEYALFFEAKKKYCLQVDKFNDHGHIDEKDSLEIDKMSVKDSSFVRYMNKQIHDSLAFTIQDKCLAFVGEKVVDDSYNHLLRAREGVIFSYFKNAGVLDRVKINKSIAIVPFDGFSYFKINYKGDIPDDLQKAYREMNDLDQKNPREKYNKERNSLGNLLQEAKHAIQAKKEKKQNY
jgi:hypothetical protein